MPEPAPDAADDIAVVGAGWAGCAAAVTLADLGHRVALIESAATLGGRARRVVRNGLALDNGAHLMLGAYRETSRLIARVHPPAVLANLLERYPLSIVPASATQRSAVSLRARALPAPLGLLAGILAAHGLSRRARLGVVGWFARLARNRYRCPAGQTVAQMLAHGPDEAAERLWAPLCLAALNTPPDQACAQTFANVLAAAFGARGGNADLLLGRVDLSVLFPDAAARYVASRGGRVETGTAIELDAVDATGVTARRPGGGQRFRAAVIAVGPHQLKRAFAPALRPTHPALASALDAVAALGYQPIRTVWLGYPAPVRVPAPLVRLDDAPGQWAFERSDILARARAQGAAAGLAQLVGVVISAHGPHEALDRDALAHATDAQLRRLWPGLPPSAFTEVIAERRATYACVPGRGRPVSCEVHPRVVLAGDYLDPDLPATLEAAVRSGIAAARCLHRNLAQGR